MGRGSAFFRTLPPPPPFLKPRVLVQKFFQACHTGSALCNRNVKQMSALHMKKGRHPCLFSLSEAKDAHMVSLKNKEASTLRMRGSPSTHAPMSSETLG